MSIRTDYNRRMRGFTMIEVLVYAAGIVLIIGAVTGFLYYMYDWYRTATIAPRVDQVALEVSNKLEQDLRGGTSLGSGDVYNSANSSTTITSGKGSGATTTAYALSNGRITWQQNGSTVAYLTPSDMTVTGFYLTPINTGNSTAIRYEIDIVYSTHSGTSTAIYNGLAILRQSYQ